MCNLFLANIAVVTASNNILVVNAQNECAQLQGLFLQTRDISSVVHIQNVGSLKLTNIIAKTTTSLQKDELGIRCQMVMGYKQPNKYLPVHGGIHGNSDTAHHPGTCHTDGLSGNTDILTLTYFNHLWEGGGGNKDPQRSAKSADRSNPQ